MRKTAPVHLWPVPYPDKNSFMGHAVAYEVEEPQMQDIESSYKKVEGKILIEIKLSSIVQLFNSFDPAPFREKELDTEAEKYIIDTVEDFPSTTQFRMAIYLPPDLASTEQAKKIVPAVHNHFQYRMLVTERRLRNRIKYGRFALIIGLSFLFLSLIGGQYLLSISNSVILLVIADALMITGWAAMWEPVTVLLYELWPIVRKKKLYEKISKMEVDILPLPALSPGETGASRHGS
jgi:hypothetical protein